MTTDPILLGIIVVLFGLHVWKEICHSQERSDLYNRLMAKGFAEYKEINGAREPPGSARNPILKTLRKFQREKYSGEAGD